jgi:hypothetical protein
VFVEESSQGKRCLYMILTWHPSLAI